MLGLLIQEVKTLFKSPASISILVIPLVLLVGLGYLLPSGWIVPSSITIGIVGAVLLYFGGSLEEIKRTSFMKSISLTRLSKFSFLATKILFSIFVSMIAVLWVLFFSWVFTSVKGISFLASNFSNLLPANQGGITDVLRVLPFDIDWTRVQWAQMLYAGMMTIVIAVSLSFIFVAFAKSSLSFYLMSFGYLLAMILFGGVVMPGFLISSDNSWFKNLYYLIPNFYTNNVMAYSFSGGVLPSATNSIGKVLEDISNSDLVDKLSKLPITDDVINSIHKIFFANLFDGIDFSTFTDTEQTTILQFLFGNDMVAGGGDDWNGKLKDLKNWYDGLSDQTPNITAFYNAISKPLIQGNYKGYSDLMFREIINALTSLGVDQDIIDKIDNGIMAAVIKPILWGGGKLNIDFLDLHINLPPIGKWLIFGNINFATGSTGIPSIVPIVNKIVDYLPLIQKLLPHLDLVGKALMQIIPMLLPEELASTLNDMFAKPETYNYIIPWIETGFFLIIAVIFFKWS